MTDPMPYSDFRCSIGFAEARAIVVAESKARYEREGQYIRVSRKRILGKWREIKLQEYRYYMAVMGEARHVA